MSYMLRDPDIRFLRNKYIEVTDECLLRLAVEEGERVPAQGAAVN